MFEAVEFDWTGVFLALIEFFAEALGEHLVDSKVGQEGVVVFQ